MKHIAIIGCGPAGLSAALALHQEGFQVTLFERFAEPAPVGSGLMLQPTGLAILQQLGLRDHIEQLGQRINGMLGRTAPDGKVVLNINYQVLSKGLYGIAIHRAALFHVLYQAVQQCGIRIETSKDITGLHHPNSAQTVFLREANGNKIEEAFDLVVDASGRQSKLIEYAVKSPRQTPLEYGALWTTVKLDGTNFTRHLLEQRYRAANVMVGVLPCGKLPEGENEIATLFWSLKSRDYEPLLNAGIDQWKRQVTEQWSAVEPLTDQLNDFKDLTYAGYSHHTLAKPYGKNIVFIGDAAHATSPQLGQGVNMALLDANALAATLSKHNANIRTEQDQLASFKEYARSRRNHVRVFQAASYLLTPFYQSDSKVMPMLRDTLFEPVSKLPYADRLVTALGAGMLMKPLPVVLYSPTST